MNDIILVAPGEIPAREALDYIEEHKKYGEDYLHGSSLLHQAPSYVEWLEQIRRNSDEKTAQKDWVVSSTFFAVRESDRRIVGMVDIRHTLNDFLRDKGGHIGYGVRPTERRKGYATQMLEQTLAYCAILGIERVMIACYSDNVGSRKTILKCGGQLERTFTDGIGKTVEVYWADCSRD